jgi:membrane associated rhomboid family serine protease
MYIQQNPFDNLKFFLRQKNILSRLILINLIVFVLVNLVSLILWLFGINSGIQTQFGISPIAYWFAAPSNPGLLIQKPWTIFTYMILHEDFFHILMNMIMLYFGGRIFMEYLNERKLLSTYIGGGLFGGLLYVISFNYFPVFQESVKYSVALGASASVLAIFIAIASYVPNYYVNLFFIGRVRLKHIAIFFIIIDLLSIQGTNSGGHIAHIGGALYGFGYIYLLKNGFSLNKYFSLSKFNYRKTKQKKYSNPEYKRPVSDDDYNRKKVSQQKEVDKILEKISKSGYSSLTKKEKEFLFKNSNKK